ncbi:hypothetical protein JCM13267_11660 [Howardella ureilytica]
MKKTKKLLSVLLSGGLIAILLAGCGSSSGSSTPAASNPVETTSAPEVKFEEVTVVDNDECAIKITDIDADNMWGDTLKVYLENKNAEKTYMYSVVSASVNGIEVDPLFANKVAAGKKANKEINFMDDCLKKNGIEFTDIAMTFRVYDSNELADYEEVARETVHVYPLGEENATLFVREEQASDQVLIDNEKCKATVIGTENDSILGYTLNLYLENKSDSSVMFYVEDVSVNGYMIDPFWARSVSAGNVAFSDMSFNTSAFEENNIETVEAIELTIRAYNYEDYSANDYAKETVIINP